MKQKDKKNCMPALLKLSILFLMTAMLLIPCTDAQASAKSKALKAYKAMLSKDQIDWSEDGYMVPLKGSTFALAYIDKNNVPELIIINPNVSHAGGWGRLYTYKNGKVKLVESLRSVDPFYSFKKTGIYVYSDVNMGNSDQYYYKLSKSGSAYAGLTKSKLAMDGYSKTHYYIQKSGVLNEVSKSKFNKKLKTLVGSKKATKAVFRKNTKANLNKYLK